MKPAFSLRKLSALSLADKLKWLLFILLIIAAAFRRFSLPQIPFADHDLNGYLNPALVYFKTGTFVHFNYRSFPYPLFLLVVIAITNSLKAIAITQHSLGLLTGVLMFKIWDEAIFKGYGGKPVKIVATTLQFICVGYFLLSADMIFFEHSLRPESTSTFLMVLVMFLLVKSLTPSHRKISLLSLALFLTLFTFVYSPRWGFALPVTVTYILFAVARLDIFISAKLRVIAVPLVLFLVLVWLPERYLINKYDPQTDQLAFRQFFYDHGNIAKSLIKEDSKTVESANPFNLEILCFIDSAIAIEPVHDFSHGAMGFDPDSLMYGRAGRSIDSVLRNSSGSASSFFRKYDQEIVLHGFSKYTKRVFTELGLYYWSYPNHERMFVFEPDSLNHIYVLTKASLYNDMDNGGYPFKTYKKEVLSMPDYNFNSHFRLLNVLYYALQLSFLPTLILFMLVYYTRARFINQLNASEAVLFNLLASACWLTFLVHFALVATIATIHTVGISRYVESIFPIALLLQAFCLLYLFIACSSLAKKTFSKSR